MGLGSLTGHDIKLICRIRGETNHSSSYKCISPSQCSSNKPKPHSLAHAAIIEENIVLF